MTWYWSNWKCVYSDKSVEWWWRFYNEQANTQDRQIYTAYAFAKVCRSTLLVEFTGFLAYRWSATVECVNVVAELNSLVNFTRLIEFTDVWFECCSSQWVLYVLYSRQRCKTDKKTRGWFHSVLYWSEMFCVSLQLISIRTFMIHRFSSIWETEELSLYMTNLPLDSTIDTITTHDPLFVVHLSATFSHWPQGDRRRS